MALSRTQATFEAPIVQAHGWLAGVTHSADRPLIDVSQAAPVAPPPAPLRAEMARLIMDAPDVHLYGPVLGLPALRETLAARWSAEYGGTIAPAQVAITAGCNQAFAAAIAALCGEGDEVILPVPYYFNHRMWLDMQGVTVVPLAVGDTMLPDAQAAARLITPRTRAIALVSPNNPTGVEYPADTLRTFAQLAAAHGIKLILDETYRDFHATNGHVHDLFTDPDWADVLVHLYSFSKAYRLTGHRVGALIASTAVLAEAEKFLDTVTICPNQIGQRAALWGMTHLGAWLADERQEILNRRSALSAAMARLTPQGWALRGCGAYFAYVAHPYSLASDQLAQRLVSDASILALPGTMFATVGDAPGQRHLRIAFANIDSADITALVDRLENLSL